LRNHLRGVAHIAVFGAFPQTGEGIRSTRESVVHVHPRIAPGERIPNSEELKRIGKINRIIISLGVEVRPAGFLDEVSANPPAKIGAVGTQGGEDKTS
jgi:hypothetical protein